MTTHAKSKLREARATFGIASQLPTLRLISLATSITVNPTTCLGDKDSLTMHVRDVMGQCKTKAVKPTHSLPTSPASQHSAARSTSTEEQQDVLLCDGTAFATPLIGKRDFHCFVPAAAHIASLHKLVLCTRAHSKKRQASTL